MKKQPKPVKVYVPIYFREELKRRRPFAIQYRARSWTMRNPLQLSDPRTHRLVSVEAIAEVFEYADRCGGSAGHAVRHAMYKLGLTPKRRTRK